MPIPILGAVATAAVKVTPALIATVGYAIFNGGKGVKHAGEGIAKFIDAKNRNKDRKERD